MILFNKRNYPEFSNFPPCSVNVGGRLYKNSEAAFQHGKLVDGHTDDRFLNATGSEAKKMGKTVPLRPDWEKIKYEHMKTVLYAKFSQNPELKEKLLATGQEWLVEDTTAWHDNVWGACGCSRCVNKQSYNLLGQALMEVRSKLRNDEGCPIYIDWVARDIQCEFDLVGDEVADMKKEGTWNNMLNNLNRVIK